MSIKSETRRGPPDQATDNEEQYRLLFEANPNPMWVHEEETLAFLAVNDAALRLYGYSRQEFHTFTLMDLCPGGAIRSGLEAAETPRPERGAPDRFWRHRKKDGSLMDVALSISSVAFSGCRARLVLVQDVTEKRFEQEALRLAREQLELRVQVRTADLAALNEALVESQDRFRQMADNIRDVFWLANPTMTSVIYVSPAYREIWGRRLEDLYSNPSSWYEAIHPEDRPRQRQIFRKPIGPHGYQCSYRVVSPDGSVRWVLERGFPVRDGAGRFYRLAGIVRDITESKELEKEVLAISEREQRRIGQDLHDDLCQQLVGIEFLSKALEQQLGAQPTSLQAREIAEAIRSAIDHTRLLAHGLVPIELEAEGLMRGLQSLATRTSDLFRIHCLFHCPVPVPIEDVAVGTCLYRIAQEAVNNGLKHGKARHIDIRLTVSVENVELSVKDDGVGFSDQARSPHGMGLRIMQHRADVIGASFGINKEPQGGTKVVCTVALAQGQTGVPATKPLGAPGGMRTLVSKRQS